MLNNTNLEWRTVLKLDTRDLKKPHCTWEFRSSARAVPVQVPYLNTFQGKKFIRNNDWIIKYGNGRMTLMHDKEFNTTYEKVEGQEDY